MDTPDTEQYKCKSYYNDKQELCDCSCGKCGIDETFRKIDEYYRENFDESMPGKRMYITELISSRDTYWKERVRKEVRKEVKGVGEYLFTIMNEHAENHKRYKGELMSQIDRVQIAIKEYGNKI